MQTRITGLIHSTYCRKSHGSSVTVRSVPGLDDCTAEGLSDIRYEADVLIKASLAMQAARRYKIDYTKSN